MGDLADEPSPNVAPRGVEPRDRGVEPRDRGVEPRDPRGVEPRDPRGVEPVYTSNIEETRSVILDIILSKSTSYLDLLANLEMCEEYVFKNMSLTDKLKNIGGELFWSACLLALSTQIIVANKEIVFGGAKFAASYVLYSTAFARPLKPPIQTNPPPVAATQASPSPTPATQPGPSPKNTSATQTNPSPAATTQAGSSPTTATQAVSSFDYTNPKAIAISLVGIDWLVFLFITGFALWGACLRRPPLGWAPKLLRASLLFVTGQMTVALTVLGVASGIAGAAGGGGH